MFISARVLSLVSLPSVAVANPFNLLFFIILVLYVATYVAIPMKTYAKEFGACSSCNWNMR